MAKLTRIQLAKQDASKVRKDPALFAIFKEYVTADAPLLYANGKLPAGCFGCQFQSFFSKWKRLIFSEQNFKVKKNGIMNNEKTFQLKNKATKFYFDGGVLDINSSDEQWYAWINYPASGAKVEQRKQYFDVLPKGIEIKEVVEPVQDKVKEVEQTDSETEAVAEPKTAAKKATRKRKK